MFKYGTWSYGQFQGQEKDVSFCLGENPGFCFERTILGKDFRTSFQHFQGMITLTLANKKFIVTLSNNLKSTTLKLTAVYNVAH